MAAAASLKPNNSQWWKRIVTQGAILFALWLLLSGHYDVFHIALGVFSVALVLWMDRAFIRDVPGDRDIRLFRLLLYIPWLWWQMILSAWYVARLVMARRMPIAPVMISFHSNQPTQMARVILANSITLTPGTLTVDLDDNGNFLVHCITKETADGVLNGSMQRQVARMFVDNPTELVENVRVGQGTRLY